MTNIRKTNVSAIISMVSWGSQALKIGFWSIVVYNLQNMKSKNEISTNNSTENLQQYTEYRPLIKYMFITRIPFTKMPLYLAD